MKLKGVMGEKERGGVSERGESWFWSTLDQYRPYLLPLPLLTLAFRVLSQLASDRIALKSINRMREKKERKMFVCERVVHMRLARIGRSTGHLVVPREKIYVKK